MAKMTEEFLDWAVQQEEGIVITAGYDPTSLPSASLDQDRGDQADDQSSTRADLARKPGREVPATATRAR